MGVADEFGYAHHSGRYDTAPGSVASTAVSLTKIPLVAVIAFTEVATSVRYKALAGALNSVGWGLVYQPKNNPDTAIGYDTAVFTHRYTTTKLLANVGTPGHGGLRNAWAATFTLLVHVRSQNTYLVTAGHTPSHLVLPSQAKAHREGMRAWHRELLRLTVLWRPSGGRIVSVDLNMDAARRSVRQYLAQVMSSMHLVADSDYVHTHDSRTIDVILIGRRLNPVRWFRGRYLKVISTPDSDHRVVVARLRRGR